MPQTRGRGRTPPQRRIRHKVAHRLSQTGPHAKNQQRSKMQPGKSVKLTMLNKPLTPPIRSSRFRKGAHIRTTFSFDPAQARAALGIRTQCLESIACLVKSKGRYRACRFTGQNAHFENIRNLPSLEAGFSFFQKGSPPFDHILTGSTCIQEQLNVGRIVGGRCAGETTDGRFHGP